MYRFSKEGKRMLKELLAGIACLELKSDSKSWNKMLKVAVEKQMVS